MYVGSNAICVLNWNWWSTQDHSLIKHWSQGTHRCSARVVGLGYSLGLVSRYSMVRSGTLTWREWGLWSKPTLAYCQRTIGPSFNAIQIKIHRSSFPKMKLQMSFVKSQPFRLGFRAVILNATGGCMKNILHVGIWQYSRNLQKPYSINNTRFVQNSKKGSLCIFFICRNEICVPKLR